MRTFTQDDKDRSVISRTLTKDPAKLLAASGLDLPADVRQAVLSRLGQMPITWRNLYLRAVAGSQAAAIKAHCGECVGWERDEITKCTAPACPLYAVRPFRP